MQKKTEQPLPEQDQKMGWWREARFGLFIHWGLYAQPAGVWKGEEIPGISEWIMARAAIPVKEYEQLATTFNPVKFSADEWVSLAKQAGVRYIVITSKHHDGFAMFHSRASSYNIVDATPFDRDPLKELAEACKKQGMRLGFYYSQAQDWHEPGGTYYNIEQGEPHWDPDLVREPLMNYIEGKAVPQVKEILENYGGLDILWWDTPRGMTLEAAEALQAVADDYPDLITNNRLYRP
jgi:alpha-L-fucosidase